MNKKEQKEIFLNLAEHLRKVAELYKKAILSPKGVQSQINEIIQLEKEADLLRDKLDAEFKQQKNIPYLALDRAKLLRKIDDSIDDFAKAAYTLQQFSKEIPKQFRNDITTYASITHDIAKELAYGISVIFESFKDASIHVENIQELRDRGMELGYQLISYYFEILDEEEGWKPFIAIERILLTSLEAMSTMKATGEILELMIYKYD